MDFALKNHPSQLQINHVPQFDDDGKPIPLFPHIKMITLDGHQIGFVSRHGVRFTEPKLGPIVYAAAIKFAEEEFPGEVAPSVATAPDMTEIDTELDEDDE